jgi:uncharacterized RDD family membrane protein YckC
MVNDSVREELQTKIGISKKLPPKPPVSKPASEMAQSKSRHESVAPPERVAAPEAVAPPAPPKPIAKPAQTVQLHVQKTSPTLVGFQAKNPSVPDWRLQLQNAVRHRKVSSGGSDTVQPSYEKQLVTSGANALKPEYVEVPKPEPVPAHKNPRVANALKRITESRNTFLNEPVVPKPATPATSSNKNFPFNVVQRESEPASESRAAVRARVNTPPKPRLVPSAVSKKGYDTNKLPQLQDPEVISSFDMPVALANENAELESNAVPVSRVSPVAIAEEPYVEEVESDEIEDLAPFSMRFNAGLFDLIIGAFASLILLSPLAFLGGDWISFSGLLAFAATSLIFMFVYMTVCLGLYGKTFGMRMFSLELIDADENEYPTFHQAAVSSAAYLLALPLLGVGFLTVLFNEEKRAVHDLLSGTIIVVEF